jgi:hypothetical protein
MTSWRSLLIVVLLSIFAAVNASAQDTGGRPFKINMSGAAEVPGPGDPDGSGTATITLNQGKGEVCYSITVADIATPTMAHIHTGAAGASGPPVVTLFTGDGPLSGCVSADADLIKAIRQNPEGYYVNVHTADFTAGAVRGQLSKKKDH